MHSSHISLKKHRTYLLKTILSVKNRTEERAFGCTSSHYSVTAVCLQLCCPSVLHLHNGTAIEGKLSPLINSRRIKSPVQWHNSLSPDQSGLASTLKITLGDTPSGFSKQLMMNTPFTQKDGSTNSAGPCMGAETTRLCSVSTLVYLSVRRDTWSFNPIWSKYIQRNTYLISVFWLSYMLHRLDDYLSAITVSLDFCVR